VLSLRPFQKEALNALQMNSLNPAHVICISPTGSGKSLIYEKAALFSGTRILLMTPLSALARQQAKKLKALNIPVTLSTGGETAFPSKNSGVWILSPEKLKLNRVQSHLHSWKPHLLVVDECHCLWEWGEKFRPAFQAIPQLFQIFSIQKSLWLTATLPYLARLKLKTHLPCPIIEIGEFKLPKAIHIFVYRIPFVLRTQWLLNWVCLQKKAGIIFTLTRTSAQRLARVFQKTSKKIILYHAGMSQEERRNQEIQIQKQFPDVIIATSAFGMGMDYSYLNYVVLHQAPLSILNLMQSIGRVGRNSAINAKALVLWDRSDFQSSEWMTKNSQKSNDELVELLKFFETPHCRIQALSSYFNPKTPLPQCQQCDHCLISLKEVDS